MAWENSYSAKGRGNHSKTTAVWKSPSFPQRTHFGLNISPVLTLKAKRWRKGKYQLHRNFPQSEVITLNHTVVILWREWKKEILPIPCLLPAAKNLFFTSAAVPTGWSPLPPFLYVCLFILIFILTFIPLPTPTCVLHYIWVWGVFCLFFCLIFLIKCVMS